MAEAWRTPPLTEDTRNIRIKKSKESVTTKNFKDAQQKTSLHSTNSSNKEKCEVYDDKILEIKTVWKKGVRDKLRKKTTRQKHGTGCRVKNTLKMYRINFLSRKFSRQYFCQRSVFIEYNRIIFIRHGRLRNKTQKNRQFRDDENIWNVLTRASNYDTREHLKYFALTISIFRQIDRHRSVYCCAKTLGISN